MQRGVALKRGRGSTLILALNELKQHFQTFLQGKHFLLFLPGVQIWFKSVEDSASPLGSSSVLLVRFESVMMIPARMCLTFCAQTLVLSAN